MEQYVDDIRAVLDEVGAKRAVIHGYLAGCTASIVFAATYPERVQSLILMSPYARLLVDDDYPIGFPPETVDQAVQLNLQGWGKAGALQLMDPKMWADVGFRNWWARLERLAASPGTAATLIREWFNIDVRRVLPSVNVPTLVISRTGQALFNCELAKYVADHIPGAKYVELPGPEFHYFMGDTEPVFRAIEDFLGTRSTSWESERSLGTVLVADIVKSTELAARLGDARFRDLLESFRRLIVRQLERFHGRLIETAGDGVLALFDSPGRAIVCAQAVRDGVRGLGIEVHEGLHTGEVEETAAGRVDGIAVQITEAIAKLAGANEILVSRTIKDLVAGSSTQLRARGLQKLPGLDDEWELFAVNQ
jgi:class 3 adenylate cyclase